MSGGAFAVTHHPVSSGAGGTADRNRSHWSTSKTPSYTKSVSWQHHLKNQPDYLTFLRAMDGFEVNGLRLFSLSIPEPSVKNLFAVNEFYRNNDDFINPDLQERLVIGDDSISIFTYDIKSNFFEIRDNIGTENIFSSFSDFSSFLNEIMDSCS
ncbi:YrhA family protein [Escherichia coli]|nr:YrhA family protein [Escherichia coli]